MANNVNLVLGIDSTGADLRVGSANPLPVTMVEGIGSIIWGPPTPVASTGASATLKAANAARKGLIIINPIVNGQLQMSYDLSGGVVTLAGGIPLLAGDRDVYTGADTPLTAITFIGTNTQNLLYCEGT